MTHFQYTLLMLISSCMGTCMGNIMLGRYKVAMCMAIIAAMLALANLIYLLMK